MRQLESLLQNISPTERQEALQYYNDYFDDAGEENEQSVIEALGNPARVAENIKKEIYGSGYGEAGQRPGSADRAVVKYQWADVSDQKQAQESEKKNDFPAWAVVLLVIGAIALSPGLLGLAGGVLGLLVGIIVAWFSLIVSFGVAAVALFIVLIVLLVTGIMCLFADPLLGMAMLGAGLLCGGIGILFLMLTVAMAGIATPAIIKWLCSLFSGKKKNTSH